MPTIQNIKFTVRLMENKLGIRRYIRGYIAKHFDRTILPISILILWRKRGGPFERQNGLLGNRKAKRKLRNCGKY